MAMATHTHYGISMNAVDLRKWADQTAKDIVFTCEARKVTPIFLYSGMSGIASATALMLSLPSDFQYGMAYVRKDNEDSHGCAVELAFVDGPPTPNKCIFVFVDDFVCSGNTFAFTFRKYMLRFSVEIKKTQIYTAFSRGGTFGICEEMCLEDFLPAANKAVRKQKKIYNDACDTIFKTA